MRDAEQFDEISDALRCIGVPDTEIHEIYKIVSGVMAFGNVQFIDSGDTRGTEFRCIAIQCLGFVGNKTLVGKLNAIL